jgi:glutamine phosphoribosylpyrophosphate amidotransferase
MNNYQKIISDEMCSFCCIYKFRTDLQTERYEVSTIRKDLCNLAFGQINKIICDNNIELICGIPNTGIEYGRMLAKRHSIKYIQLLKKSKPIRTLQRDQVERNLYYKQNYSLSDNTLNDTVKVVRTDINNLQRATLEALIVLDVHAKDVI